MTGDAEHDALAPTGDAGDDVCASEGQRLLCAVPESTSQVGAKVGASKNTVSCWRIGTKRPAAAARARMHELYGIVPSAWDALPTGARVTAESAPAPATGPVGSTLALIDRQIALWQAFASDATLALATRAKVSDGPLAKYVALKARLERESEFLELKIVREHPEFKRLVRTIVDAIQSPDELRRVRDALESNGVREQP